MITSETQISQAPPALVFSIIGGPVKGKEIQVSDTKIRIGRTKTSGLQIKDPAVSEKHAEVAYVEGRWRIRDLGSSNGTLLNGLGVTGDFMVLTNGDKLRFGTESTARVAILSGAMDSQTVQEYLEAECEKLEQHIRSHAAKLAYTLTSRWSEHRNHLTAIN